MDVKKAQTQLSLLLLLLLAGSVSGQAAGQLSPTPATTAVDIIKARGFHSEMYTVQSNGYPLSMYRIINPLANPLTLNKYPVLYGHGVLYDAKSMISRSENSCPRKPELGRPSVKHGSQLDPSDDHSLPFMFSNNNFDVWLFDSKGTNFINRNASVNNDPNHAHKFWDFSLDEQALIDLPLLIDFVLTKTASKKLVYVGYSESTFFMFALMTTAPEYQAKVAAFISLAPVAYVAHIRGLTVPLLAPVATLTPEFIHESFAPQPVIDTVNTALREPCRLKGLANIFCGAIVNSIGGRGTGELRPDFFSEFFKSTSLKAIKHFLQLNVGQRFGMYDYGPIENLRRYGQPNPPAYDLSRIKSDRLILIRGLSDFLSDPEDQERLIRELGTKPYLDVAIPQYNHFDFIDGKDLVRLVNEPIMVAVFELMYKDGPDIFRTPAQNQAIALADTDPNTAALPVAGHNVAPANSRLLMNRNNQPTMNNLLRNSAGLIQTLTGAKDMFRDLAAFVGR